MTIAGHMFAMTPGGRCCIAFSSVKGGTCGISWLHTRSCRAVDVGVTLGLAHQGAPNMTEYNEIQAEITREEKHLWDAVVDASSAGSR